MTWIVSPFLLSFFFHHPFWIVHTIHANISLDGSMDRWIINAGLQYCH